VRAPDGTFTSFDPSGSVFTDPAGVNAMGKIMGFYADVNSVYHGFERASPRSTPEAPAQVGPT